MHPEFLDRTYNGFSVQPVSLQTREAGAPSPAKPRKRGAQVGAVGLLALLLVGVFAGLHYRSEPRRAALPATATETAASGVPPALVPAPDLGAADLAPRAKPPAPATRLRVPAPVKLQAARGPAFHCDWPLRPSERIVCNDPTLATLDRRLNHAFGAAVRAGAPRAKLRAEQDRWVFHREVVARRSHAALVRYYRERIAMLEALASRPR